MAGPPQAVAITPDAKLAIVSGPSHYDYAAKKESFGTFLQPVDLAVSPPKVLQRVDIGAHPNGIAINREGTLLLAATLEGSVKVLTVSGNSLKLADTLDVCSGRLSGVSFTHDGRSAIVACRDFGGATVLDVDGTKVTVTKERVSTGVGPYTIDVSSEGGLAVIGGAGIAALANSTSASDLDTVALVDVSKRPFHTVQFLNVPATPEDAAISPDGKWIVVQSLNGSNVPAGSPGVGRREKNKITLFAIKNGLSEKVDQIDGGEAGQGIVFASDSRTIISQNNVERELVAFQVVDGKLVENGKHIAIAAGPSSIRAAPR